MGGFSLNALEIQDYQKNRYPFLLIDRVTEVVPGKTAKGYKNLTMNEWFFPPHYEDDYSMPGALQVEAMNQMFLMTFLTLPEYKGKLVVSLAYDKVRLHRLIIPGDRLDIESELVSLKRGIAKGKSVGYVNGELACSNEVTTGIPDELKQFTPEKT